MTDPSTPAPATRLPVMLRVGHWELLLVCALFLIIYVTRQGGNLPGDVIRLLDVSLVVAALGLTMHAGNIGRRTVRVHVLIAATAIVLDVLGGALSSQALARIAEAIASYLVAVVAFFIMRLILRQHRVTGDTLFGAIAVYLAIGVLFAKFYTLIARWDPEAFEPAQPVIDGQTDLYYFSFITLASLGYGDIAPASDLVRVLAPLEAVIGVILLAALVGRIVGLLVAQTTSVEASQHLDALARAVERLEGDEPERRDPPASGPRSGPPSG